MLQSGSLTLNISTKLKKKLEDIILISLLQESINSLKNIYILVPRPAFHLFGPTTIFKCSLFSVSLGEY